MISSTYKKKEVSRNWQKDPLAIQTALEQRYLFFRSWYTNKKIVDLCTISGFGTDYITAFSKTAQGIFQEQNNLNYAQQRYPDSQFKKVDLEEIDYGTAELILGFNLLEQAKKPEKILEHIKKCKNDIILSASMESDIDYFKKLINKTFSHRKVQYLWQEAVWPYLIKNHPTQDPNSIIAVISDQTLPTWPRLGIAIPTHIGSADLEQAFISLSRGYPGETYFAISANGCNPENLQLLKDLEQNVSHILKVISNEENLGYGRGTNIALQYLLKYQKSEYYIVSNDDILATRDCLCLLTEAMRELKVQVQNPGIITPVSNAVAGTQLVNIGPFNSLESMNQMAEIWHKNHHEDLFINPQVRGLFMVIHHDLINKLGGFDPLFGIGNFEDDDYNIRARLAGYSLWIAQGAFLYHKGSQTFQKLNIDYAANIQQNGRLFNRKWRVEEMQQAFDITEKPQHIDLYIPFDAQPIQPKYTIKLDKIDLDLVNEATNYEFLGWMMYMLTKYPQIDREKIIKLVYTEADLPPNTAD